MGTSDCILIVSRMIAPGRDDVYIREIQENGFRVKQLRQGNSPLSVMEREKPLVVCFEFDHPDLPGLAELRMVKERIPSVPVLMVTQAHSESLAVWAFRTGVWDYFAQPVDTERLVAILGMLAQARAAPERRRRVLRGLGAPPNVIPPEVRVPGNASVTSTAALDSVPEYVSRNLHDRIVQAEVAARCGLSPFQFSRLFKRKFEMTFQEYVQNARIEQAKVMLAHPGASVTDVCFNVGFHDLSYFTRTFQRYVGQTPSHYRLTRRRQPKVGKVKLVAQQLDVRTRLSAPQLVQDGVEPRPAR